MKKIFKQVLNNVGEMRRFLEDNVIIDSTP